MNSIPSPPNVAAPAETRYPRRVLSALLIFAGGGAFLPGPLLWGLNHGAYAPHLRILAVSLSLLGLCALWMPAISRAAPRIVGAWHSALLSRRLVVYVLGPCLGAGLFWIFRVPLHLLGDGMLITTLPDSQVLFHGFDLMAYHLPARLSRAGVGGTATVFAVISCLSGAAYLAAAGWAARNVGAAPRERVLLHALLVLCAPLLMAFGYAECYGQLAVGILLFTATLSRWIDGRGSLVWPSAWFAFGMFWHLNALFVAPIFAASVLICGGPRTLLRRVAIAAAPLAVTAAALALVYHLAGLSLADLWLQLTESQNGRTLFNPLHGDHGLLDELLWKDTANLWLLLAPVPTALLLTGRGIRDRMTAVLVLGVAWLVLLSLVLNLKLGPVRDWDLFAAFGCLAVFAAWALSRRSLSDALTVGAAAAALALTIPWIALNHSESATLQRLSSATSDLPAYTRAIMFEDIGRHHHRRGRAEQKAEAFHQAAEACPAHWRFHLLDGQALYTLGKFDDALPALRRASRMNTDSVLAQRMVSLCAVATGDYGVALEASRMMAGQELENADDAERHGQLADHAGLYQEALEAYRRVLAAEPERHEAREIVAGLCMLLGRYEEAVISFEALATRGVITPGARLGLAEALYYSSLTATPTASEPRLRRARSLLRSLIAADTGGPGISELLGKVDLRLETTRPATEGLRDTP